MNRTNHQLTFETNGFYERIIALRKSQPKAFESLSPATKQALGAYETAKREHTRLEAIRSEASGTEAA
jgi:hypothetical protein